INNAIAKYSNPRRTVHADSADNDYPATGVQEPGTGVAAPDRTVAGGALSTPIPTQATGGKRQRASKVAGRKSKKHARNGDGSEPGRGHVVDGGLEPDLHDSRSEDV